jgi:limonene-1,2-epoxide hydrolase
MTTQAGTASDDVKHVIGKFAKALNDENFQLARKYVSDGIKNSNPISSHDNAEAYFEELERLRLKYKIRKIFADGNEACVLYDVTASGVTLFASGWFQVEDGKVSSLRVVFDPTPLLAAWDASK